MREDGELNAYDNESASVIRLNNSTVLYLREVNRYAALHAFCLLFRLQIKSIIFIALRRVAFNISSFFLKISGVGLHSARGQF